MSHATITVRTRYFQSQSYRSIDVHVDSQPRTSWMVAGSEGYRTEAPREQEAIANVIKHWAEPRGYTAEFVGELPEVPARKRRPTSVSAPAWFAAQSFHGRIS